MSQTTSKAGEFRSLYQKYIESFNTRDFEVMKSFYASPVNVMDKRQEPDDIIAMCKYLLESFPDWKGEVRHIVIEGDYMTVHFKDSGTHQGEFRGYQATGRKVETTEVSLYHVVDGKFAEVWPLVDFDTVVEQIK
ncbi:hypothetical protein FPSE_03945 [Fusarium pseudograminearum CS3096]|uniref:SnoaL-like domain-containing protein n=1 Tax=Fusarium pseudograminearum (strain CS3096) TaxID=1028729 RepID=K3W1E6_FUSPC|nr:hypothetical protein FPSE_03945 [Fusarium pseudograminearum CS3096]EKJ75765.1 hypothetical protein FPSE_03945 [Fusarium pseudograminearum CS3096]